MSIGAQTLPSIYTSSPSAKNEHSVLVDKTSVSGVFLISGGADLNSPLSQYNLNYYLMHI
jgi:hypothetical protein